MSRNETPMTIWYWEKNGGTLIEEFLAVSKMKDQGRRLIDGIIILDEEKKRLPVGTKVSLEDKDVIVIQTKNERLGMYLMGQTLFSLQLIKKYFNPRSARAVALCQKSDKVLQPMLEAYEGCEVVVCPPEVCRRQSSGSDTDSVSRKAAP